MQHLDYEFPKKMQHLLQTYLHPKFMIVYFPRWNITILVRDVINMQINME